MDINDLRKKEIEGLRKMLDEERKNVANIKLNYIVGKEKDIRKKSEGRKNIAQILTVIREKEILNG